MYFVERLPIALWHKLSISRAVTTKVQVRLLNLKT